jgi:hypothetical protein
MNCHDGIAEIRVHYEEGPVHLDKEVFLALQKSFGTILSRGAASGRPLPLQGIAAAPEEVADRLARIIFNFSRAATAHEPSDQAVAGTRPRLLEFVQKEIPVEAQMLWSPKKHWVHGPDSAIDLAELAAFDTLVSIDAAVRRAYSPGMSFVIDLEDIEFQFMESQSEEVVNAQNIYVSGMKRLVKALGLDELFTLGRMSERAKDPGELNRWRQQMAENYRALEVYWHDSEASPVSSWETLSAFKAIRRLGWKGTIPPEMRNYYLSRLGRLTSTTDAEKVGMVLRNLAGILLHYQMDLLRGSGQRCPLKFSFVRAADGAPGELLPGRVDLRFAPRKLCSRISAAAPWATKGFVCGREDNVRVSFRGWHELADAKCQFAQGWLDIAGNDNNARVRADFMRED